MAVVISSELVLNAAELAVPLSHPRILYDDVFRDGTVTASSEATDFAAANAADGLTWDYWKPTALPAQLTVTLTTPRDVDYALLVHDLGTMECTVKGQYHNGSTWVDLFDEYSPGTDKVLAFLFESVFASQFRFHIDGESSPQQMPSIAIAMMGEALAVERGVVLNHRPITMSRKTVVRQNKSDGGQTLGRSILREGVQTQIAFQHLTAAWVRSHFDPFIEAARVHPFGWVWHPVDYPAEVAFCYLPDGKEDIRPEHAGLQDRMNVAFEVEGIIEI